MDLADDIFYDMFPEVDDVYASAFLHKKRGDLLLASNQFEEILRSEVKSPSEEAMVLYELATLDSLSADYELSLNRFEAAMSKAREINHSRLECAILYGFGYCYSSLKRHTEAAYSFKELGKVAFDLGYDLYHAVSHCCLAKAYVDGHEFGTENALKELDAANEIINSKLDCSEPRVLLAITCARVRLHLATCCKDENLKARQLELAKKTSENETLSLAQMNNDIRAKFHICQAQVFLIMSDYETSLRFAQHAAAVAQTYSVVGEVDAVLCAIHFKMNNPTEGFICGDKALDMFKRAARNIRDFELNLEIVNLFLSYKRFDPTQTSQLTREDIFKLSDYIMPATVFIKTLQMRLTNDAHKLAFSDISNEASELVQLMYIAIGDTDTALGCAESSRTMSLISGMERKHLDTSIDLNLLQLLESSILPSGMLKVVETNCDSAIFFSFMRNRFFEGFVAWVFHPSQGALHASCNIKKFIEAMLIPCTYHTLDETIRILQGNIASMSREIGVVGRDASREERNALVEDDLALFDQHPREPTDILQELYRIVLKPIENNVSVLNPSSRSEGALINKRLLIIPNADLLLLPFPALVNERGQHLCDFLNVTVTPSIKLLAHLSDLVQTNTGSGTFLVVGNPLTPPEAGLCSLPGAEREAKNVAALFTDAELLIRESARKDVVMERMKEAEVIHFACHGSWTENYLALALSPPDSGSVGAGTSSELPNYRLTADEVAQVPLRARLVVLSACNSGRGRVTGEGVIGLARSFIAAGARAVLVALWQLPDDATELIMTSFYSKFKVGESASSALRLAMKQGQQRNKNPFYWAAFYLIGVEVYFGKLSPVTRMIHDSYTKID